MLRVRRTLVLAASSLALALTLAHWLRTPPQAHAYYHELAWFIALLLGCAGTSRTLREASREACPPAAGIGSALPSFLWAFVALGVTAIVMLHAHGETARNLFLGTRVVLTVTPHPAAAVALACLLATLPFALVPWTVDDVRTTMARALTLSLVRTSRMQALEIVRGPLAMLAPFPIVLAASTDLRTDTLVDACVLGVAIGIASVVTLGGVERTARAVRDGAMASAPPTLAGASVICIPSLASIVAVATWTFVHLPGGDTTEVMPSAARTLLWVHSLLAAGIGAWALATRTRVKSDASRVGVRLVPEDVIEIGGRHVVRDGAWLTLDRTGARVAAGGRCVVGMEKVSPSDDTIEAWILARPREATYRTAPAAFQPDAIVHVGAPRRVGEDALFRWLDRVSLPWSAVSVALVMTTGLTLASDGRALLLLAWAWTP